jgi:1D-myo-inositol 3-kinase
VSILVVGNYCHDTLVSRSRAARALGGSAAYAGAVLAAFDESFEVAAKVGKDFLYHAQVARPARIAGLRTTSFVDDYRGGEREQTLEAVCEPIWPEDLSGKYDVGIACAVAGEVPEPTLARMRDLCGTIVVDAQGLLREISASNQIQLRPPATKVFGYIDVLKASRREATLLDLGFLRQRLHVLVTDGPRGCDLLTRETAVHIPAFAAKEIDPTGAGDCFLAGFAVGLSRGFALLTAARLGAWCGARAVELIGVPQISPAEAERALQLVRDIC